MRRTRDDSPPEKRWPRGAQVHHLYVERGDEEVEVKCEMDEGEVASAWAPGRVSGWVPFELTADEMERAAVDYQESLVAREEAAREDDADRRADR